MEGERNGQMDTMAIFSDYELDDKRDNTSKEKASSFVCATDEGLTLWGS